MPPTHWSVIKAANMWSVRLQMSCSCSLKSSVIRRVVASLIWALLFVFSIDRHLTFRLWIKEGATKNSCICLNGDLSIHNSYDRSLAGIVTEMSAGAGDSTAEKQLALRIVENSLT